MNKDIQALASQLYSPIFAECDTIRRAYELFHSVAMQCENPAAVTASVHVLMNTIAVEMEKLNDTPVARVVVTGKRTADAEATEEETARCPGL
jgi:hypothetical protein